MPTAKNTFSSTKHYTINVPREARHVLETLPDGEHVVEIVSVKYLSNQKVFGVTVDVLELVLKIEDGSKFTYKIPIDWDRNAALPKVLKACFGKIPTNFDIYNLKGKKIVVVVKNTTSEKTGMDFSNIVNAYAIDDEDFDEFDEEDEPEEDSAESDDEDDEDDLEDDEESEDDEDDGESVRLSKKSKKGKSKASSSKRR